MKKLVIFLLISAICTLSANDQEEKCKKLKEIALQKIKACKSKKEVREIITLYQALAQEVTKYHSINASSNYYSFFMWFLGIFSVLSFLAFAEMLKEFMKGNNGPAINDFGACTLIFGMLSGFFYYLKQESELQAQNILNSAQYKIEKEYYDDLVQAEATHKVQ